MLGENILLHYAVKNQGAEPITIAVGSDYRGSPRALRFKVFAFNEAGKQLKDPWPNPTNMGGLGITPTVKPGETFWLSIPLTKYVRFEKAGTYRLKVFHDLGWNESPYIPGTTEHSLPKLDTVAPVVEASITILEPNLETAKAVIEQSNEPRPELQWGIRCPPYGDLSTLDYPAYLPLLNRLTETDERALDTIAKIPTPEATRALINLARNGSRKARKLLVSRLPHPNLKHRKNWNTAWAKRKREVEQSWRDEFRESVMQLAWKLLKSGHAAPTENRKRGWELGGSYLSALGQAADYDRFVAVANPIVESLGNADAEQRQYPSPTTVIVTFVYAGHQLLKRGAKPSVAPRTAFESMMFMSAIQANAEFRPDGWQESATRFMRHSMGRVRSTSVASLPVPIADEFVQPIIDLFDDHSPLVAAAALTKVGKEKDVRFFEAARQISQKHKNKWVRNAASYAAKQCKPASDVAPNLPKADSTTDSDKSNSRTDSGNRQTTAVAQKRNAE